ncbi:MAG: GNAT family N-acetyltransferase [Acidimicrobiales bacterium]|nr:GNAT family N-acetyltransferase [Acidimicrobiales bacterium]
MTDEPTIVHNPEQTRYEIHLAGQRVGLTHYRVTPEAWVFDHTEIDDAHEGEGLGSRLARGALDDVRAKGHQVVAECPFIRRWIAEHPDYQDLLAT